jgi:hypothetical protein
MYKGIVVSALVICFAMISGCATYDDLEALRLSLHDLQKNVSTDMDNVKKDQVKQDDKIAALQKANAKAQKEQAQLNEQFTKEHASSKKDINSIKQVLNGQAQLNAQFKEKHDNTEKAITDIKGDLKEQAQLNEQFKKEHASSKMDISSIKQILIEQAQLNAQFKEKHDNTKKSIVSIEKYLEEQTLLNEQFKQKHTNTQYMLKKINSTLLDDVIKGLTDTKKKMNNMMDDMIKKQK